MVEDENVGNVDDFSKPTFHQAVLDARARLHEFYQPSFERHKQESAKIRSMPMSKASERVLYQQLHFDTEAELAKLVEDELKRGVEYGNRMDSGVPSGARYVRDPD